MNFLTKLVGSGIGGLANGVASAIDKFVETAEEKKAAELLLIKMQQQPDKWQVEINKIEAGHRSLFVAGWRPFIGWICGTGLACNFVIFPLAVWVTNLIGHPTPMPDINTAELMTLITLLLGMGGLRSYEKRHNLTPK